MSKRNLPTWQAPTKSDAPVLKLYNSFTRQKEEFVPQDVNRVLWYSCGPTVYDASHMGHARSYVSFDILRRVLSDYFGYNVQYVMNITDIDDKIIKRARQNHLYESYASSRHSLERVVEDAKAARGMSMQELAETRDSDKRAAMSATLERLDKAIESAEEATRAGDVADADALLRDARDPLSNWLDRAHGDEVTEHSIFSSLSRKWEEAFHKDMEALNVLPPDVLTRVSEYIPEIIEYIRRIMDNGLAYESNGSVYFDVAGFDARDNHFYAKLVPEAYGDLKSLHEGEGDLCVSEERLSEKKSPNDFALWKSSKRGEPWWESPWGRGRPGWHIECSVMASAICGSRLDIHTGGVDLKFPHHDNEIAQAEAYYDNNDWVSYFLHSGHLTISGCKMSKSLKNFVTIQEALETHSARQLRLAFLLHSWKDGLDYGANTMKMAVQYERLLNEFFLTVKDLMRREESSSSSSSSSSATCPDAFRKWTRRELELSNKFMSARRDVHVALCDNVDTRSACDAVRDLVAASNVYLSDRASANVHLLRDVARYVTKLFAMFGVASAARDDVGFACRDGGDDRVGDAASAEDLIMPYLSVLSEFRDKVRIEARRLKASDILAECDRLRDDVLPNHGVRLEDVEGRPSAVKMVDRETLLREREEKRRVEAERRAERERRKRETAAAEAAKEAQRRIPPRDMFKSETDKYSRFNEEGIPTHDADGNEISKGQMKKLAKLQQQQEKRYKEYLDSATDEGK